MELLWWVKQTEPNVFICALGFSFISQWNLFFFYFNNLHFWFKFNIWTPPRGLNDYLSWDLFLLCVCLPSRSFLFLKISTRWTMSKHIQVRLRWLRNNMRLARTTWFMFNFYNMISKLQHRKLNKPVSSKTHLTSLRYITVSMTLLHRSGGLIDLLGCCDGFLIVVNEGNI